MYVIMKLANQQGVSMKYTVSWYSIANDTLPTSHDFLLHLQKSKAKKFDFQIR